jgi:peptidoglycan/xylan/chitin deacetylase (PgdA/CDA1 family)
MALKTIDRLTLAVGRRVASWLGRRTHRIDIKRPLISFTFDDFPQSALTVAGELLRRANVSGTYYTSFGLMGQRGPTGQIFFARDLELIEKGKHEIGCHTFDHCHAWNTSPQEYLASVKKNSLFLKTLLPTYQKLTTHSYPISFPRLTTKKLLADHFRSIRGGGQEANIGNIDLNNIKSFFIEQAISNPKQIKTVIDHNSQSIGWLIFSTHDVDPNHTRYGCSINLFEQILNWSIASGSEIVTMNTATAKLLEPKQ